MSFPPQILIFLMGASPFFELRGAIPLGILYYKLSLGEALFWALLGNLLITWLLLVGIEKFIKISSLFPALRSFFAWWLQRTQKQHEQKFLTWGKFALVGIVALPFPFTGAWTGVLASVIFGIKPRTAFPLITLGVLIAGLIVSLLTLQGIFFFNK